MKHDWVVPNANFYGKNGDTKIDMLCKNKIDVEFFDYSIKFKESAYVLADHTLEGNDISSLDCYFFTLAFLYRHSIELVLKAIFFKEISDVEVQKNFLKSTYHNLSELFDYITKMEGVCLSNDLDGVNWLIQYFESINDVDKESDSFRYPFSISFDGKYSIKPVFDKQTHINLIAFVNKMEITYELLSDIYVGNFGSHKDYKEYSPTFLEEGGQYYGQSVLGYKYASHKFYLYTTAYTESASILFNKIMENKDLVGIHFIPMCYLFRNAIELSLKETLVEECSFNFQNSIKSIHRKKHKVLGLWNLIKSEIMEHANPPAGDTTAEDAELYIKQINDFDGKSDKFRYPVTKDIEYHFKKSKILDAENVHQFFVEILSFLGGINSMMSAHNEIQAEIESEFYSDMMGYY